MSARRHLAGPCRGAWLGEGQGRERLRYFIHSFDHVYDSPLCRLEPVLSETTSAPFGCWMVVRNIQTQGVF